MNSERWNKAMDIFDRAVELDKARQNSFIRQECGGDTALFDMVERMIAGDGQSHSLIDQPIIPWGSDIRETHDDGREGRPYNYIGHYRLVRRLGRPSGMGEVFLAVDDRENMKRQVALKLMQEKLSTHGIARFNEEVKSLARLNHPNIITLLDKGEVDGRPYLVMEYFDGESLQDRLDRGPVPIKELLSITDQICNALYEARSKGIVHRDIKPANIMIRPAGEAVIAKLLDFGIATLEGESTKTFLGASDKAEFIGSAPYISPEQAEGKNRHGIDHRADIYSLAAVVYHMLTGEMVFHGRTRDEFAYLHLRTAPDPPSRRRPDLHIPSTVDKVILKALEKKPEDRYQTSIEFSQALREAAEGRANKRWAPVLLPVAAVLLALVSWIGYEKLIRPGVQTPGSGGQPVSVDAGPRESPAVGGQLPARVSGDKGQPPGTMASPAPSAVDIPKPDIMIRVLKRLPGGKTEAVSEGASFRSGDYVRFELRPSSGGFIYVMQRGTDGEIEILYPRREMKDSYSTKDAGGLIQIPQPGAWIDWFQMRGKPGTETVYFVWAAEKGDPTIADLEKAVEKGQTDFARSLEEKTLARLDSLAGSQEQARTLVVKRVELNHSK